MKILVLGRTGQVGGAVARALAPHHEVTALGRAEVDFITPGAVAAAIRAARPELVVNAVAWTAVDRAETEPEAAHRVNAAAVAELAEAAAGAPVIHYSTDYVFDGSGTAPWRETDPTAPLNAYGRTKRGGEAALAASGNPHLVLRTSWVHAPGHANFVATILRLARERDTLRVVADQIGAPTSAGLIADVTARLVERYAAASPPPSGLYHLAAAGAVSWHGFAVHLIETALRHGHALRCRPEAVAAIPTSDYPQPALRPLNSRLDCSRLETLLGTPLPDWRSGAGDTLLALLGDPG